VANLRGGRSRSSFPRSQRRKTSWNIGPQTGVDGATQVISASAAVLATGTAVVLNEGITMVRTRGELNVFLSIATGQGDGFHGAFGIAVASSPAVTAGVGSVPTPITEENWDGWLYHRYFGLFAGGPLATATAADQQSQVNATTAALRVEVDSKAMRKLSVDMTIYAAIEVIELGAASSMEWGFNSRILVKLP